MNDFLEALKEVGEPTNRPKIEGYTMSVVINPKK